MEKRICLVFFHVFFIVLGADAQDKTAKNHSQFEGAYR